MTRKVTKNGPKKLPNHIFTATQTPNRGGDYYHDDYKDYDYKDYSDYSDDGNAADQGCN